MLALLLTVFPPAAASDLPPMDQFAVPIRCMKESKRCIHQEYQALMDEQTSDIAYYVARNRWVRQEYVNRLDSARYAWLCLESYEAYPCKYWANELRLTIGDEAFACGVMPPFPGLAVIE